MKTTVKTRKFEEMTIIECKYPKIKQEIFEKLKKERSPFIGMKIRIENHNKWTIVIHPEREDPSKVEEKTKEWLKMNFQKYVIEGA